MGLVYPESFTYRTETSACKKCFWSVCVDKNNTKNYNHISKKNPKTVKIEMKKEKQMPLFKD